MLFAALLPLVASFVPTLGAQVPLDSSLHWKDVILDTEPSTTWNIDKPPDPDHTDHLVFETVHSLLQHWPNTRMRNGHNIVPGVVPQGTLLYHGTNATRLPPGPDWVATDPELSYIFCQPNFQMPAYFSEGSEGCWHLTLIATRPLKVVYFDGSSAAKMPYGSLDTQDLLAWGEARPERVWDEVSRINDLCKWGKDFGVDGFVRMQGTFEIMLCDFTSGVSVVSWTSVACFVMKLPFWPPFSFFEVMNAGSWHNHLPGETRIQLDLSGLVSFYDTQLVPSLVPIRAGQERWDHRVRDVSSEDLSTLKSKLEGTLVGQSGPSSGVDWKTLIRVIVDRFAGRLELTRYLLNLPAASPEEVVDLAKKAQAQLRIMLNPYLALSVVPSDPSDKTAPGSPDWATAIYKECATLHTSFAKFTLGNTTDSEKLLLRAVRGTSREICRVVTKMWAAGVYTGVDLSLNTRESLDISEVTRVRRNWAEEMTQLMGWLDWSAWVKCDPECSAEEICYLPTWPAGLPDTPFPGHREESWARPQPKCIRRVEPYEF